MRAQEVHLLVPELEDVGDGLEAGGGTAGYQDTAPLQAVDALLPGSVPHMLEDDVHTAAIGDLAHLFQHVLLRAVDHVVGAQVVAELQAIIGVSHGDGLGAEDLADLYRDRAQAAGSAPDENEI